MNNMKKATFNFTINVPDNFKGPEDCTECPYMREGKLETYFGMNVYRKCALDFNTFTCPVKIED